MATGIVDARSLAPTNAPTNLALEFARKDQLIEGVPAQRIPVADVLAGVRPALDELKRDYARVDELLKELDKLQADLQVAQAKLIEMGRLYEAEKNRHILRRIWAWALSTLGVGGLIALCVFCPAAIPILGRLAAMVAHAVPKLAGVIGVVSVKAFDKVREGIDNSLRELPEEHKPTVLRNLSIAMDRGDKEMVRARRKAVS